jgi:hypothetical protein
MPFQTTDRSEQNAAQPDAQAASETAFAVKAHEGGATIFYGGEALDYIWQNEKQVRDLIAKLQAAIA